MKLFLPFPMILLSFAQCLAQVPPDREIQLMTAVLAAPEEMRSEATIMGYSPDGNLEVLHEGTNNLICLADDPNEPGINIACYEKDLEPFMKRGRELKAEGKGRMDVFTMRADEVEKGLLAMPEDPSTLYIFYGDEGAIDWNTGEVHDGKIRYVIYIPFATSESTGLPVKPAGPGAPWLMDAGTYRAHIMITPE